jgi:hypothetical protein
MQDEYNHNLIYYYDFPCNSNSFKRLLKSYKLLLETIQNNISVNQSALNIWKANLEEDECEELLNNASEFIIREKIIFIKEDHYYITKLNQTLFYSKILLKEAVENYRKIVDFYRKNKDKKFKSSSVIAWCDENKILLKYQLVNIRCDKFAEEYIYNKRPTLPV